MGKTSRLCILKVNLKGNQPASLRLLRLLLRRVLCCSARALVAPRTTLCPSMRLLLAPLLWCSSHALVAPRTTLPKRRLLGDAVAKIGSCDELDALVAEHAGSKSIVVDFSNTFCGPCKIMYPKFEALSERFADGALFYSCSLDESAEASTLGKREAVQIVPSFIIWKDGARLEAVEGLKPDLLVAAVSRAAETSFWAAPLGRARRKVAKFGLLGAFRKLLRNGRRRLVRAFRR